MVAPSRFHPRHSLLIMIAQPLILSFTQEGNTKWPNFENPFSNGVRGRTISYGTLFFPLRFMALEPRSWAINKSGKNAVRNFQYGPRKRV